MNTAIDKFPILKRLAKWKDELSHVLRSKSEEARNTSNAEDYAEIIQNTYSFSINKAIIENNYTKSLTTDGKTIDDVLYETISEGINDIENISEYTSYGLAYNTSIIEAPLKPLASDVSYCFNYCSMLQRVTLPKISTCTNISWFLANCTSLTDVYIEHDAYYEDWTDTEEYGKVKGYVYDLRNVKTLAYPFNGSFNINVMHEEVSLVLKGKTSGCSGLRYFGRITHYIDYHPTNWGQFLYNSSYTKDCEIITGIDCRNVGFTYSVTNWANYCVNYANTLLSHIEFVEGNYIQHALNVYTDYLDAETIYNYIKCAYNWSSNPNNLTTPVRNYIIWSQTNTQRNFFDFALTDSAKNRLIEAYGDNVLEELQYELDTKSNITLGIEWKI